MAELKRYFLVGSDRAEYEHVYGPLTSDAADPRFVLVTEEEAEKIRKFPPGVPPRVSQDWAQVKKIREAEAEAGDFDVDLSEFEAGAEDDTSTADVKAGGDQVVAGTGTPIPPAAVSASNEGDAGATDAAKELADEKGIDLSEVEGTGKDGKVTKADVEAADKD